MTQARSATHLIGIATVAPLFKSLLGSHVVVPRQLHENQRHRQPPDGRKALRLLVQTNLPSNGGGGLIIPSNAKDLQVMKNSIRQTYNC